MSFIKPKGCFGSWLCEDSYPRHFPAGLSAIVGFHVTVSISRPRFDKGLHHLKFCFGNVPRQSPVQWDSILSTVIFFAVIIVQHLVHANGYWPKKKNVTTIDTVPWMGWYEHYQSQEIVDNLNLPPPRESLFASRIRAMDLSWYTCTDIALHESCAGRRDEEELEMASDDAKENMIFCAKNVDKTKCTC